MDPLLISAFQSFILFTDGSLEVDVKDLMTRYANDVIASCAFGLKVNSHKDQDNQFYAMGKVAAAFDFRAILIIFALNSIPALSKVSKFKVVFMYL